MNEIRCNWSDLEMLVEKYGMSIEKVDEVSNIIANIQNMLDEGYKGQASEVLLPELFSKINSHIEILRMCYSIIQKYVYDAKETLKTIDSSF